MPNRILKYTGPQLNAYTLLGLGIMILGGLVCMLSAKICKNRKISELWIKLIGLAVAVIGLIIMIYLKG